MNRLLLLLFFASQSSFGQSTDVIQNKFCKALHQVFELGLKDNFDSYDGTFVKQSPFLAVPAYGIQLEKFPVNYADKDHRFIAKTNLNLDSASAVNALEEMKLFTAFCLDTLNWSSWKELTGDNLSTTFLKETKEAKTVSKDLTLTLAILSVTPKLYTLVLYVKRN